MKKVVRKIKKTNIKFLFATLLIAIIAISGGIALRGGKDTLAASTINRSMTVDAGKTFKLGAVNFGNMFQGTPEGSKPAITSKCSSTDSKKVKVDSACGTMTALEVQSQTTATIKREIYMNNNLWKTENWTITIKPYTQGYRNTYNKTLKVGETFEIAGLNTSNGITSCPQPKNPNVVRVNATTLGGGHGVTSYKCVYTGLKAGSTTVDQLLVIGGKIRYNVTVKGDNTYVPHASLAQRSVIFKTNVSNAEINGHFGSKSISSSKSYTGFYSSTANVTLPTVIPNGGYNFVGWAENGDCSKASTKNQIDASSNGITMVACLKKVSGNFEDPGDSGSYKPTPIVVQFDGAWNDGGTLTCNETDSNDHPMVCAHQTTVGARINLPNKPTKTGYEFRGWSTSDDPNTCESNLVTDANATSIVAQTGKTYLLACWGAPKTTTLRYDTCSPETRTGVTGSGSITHCINTVCRNGVVTTDYADASNITCAPGYRKVASTGPIGGSCSSELGKSCTGNGTGMCTQVWGYTCVSEASLVFNKTSITLKQGQTDNLFNYLKYKGVSMEDIKFSFAKNSSGNDIISLSSNGTVTGRNTGRITVYATAGGSEATIDVIVGSGKQACYNSLNANENHEEGDSGVVRHCMQGVCSQYGGYSFNTTAPSNYVINCVSGSKVSILKTDTCGPLQGTCTPGDKVQCYQEWAWQCLPSDTNTRYYSVTYNYLNDANDIQTVKVASGDYAPKIYATRNNYTFEGWYVGGRKFDFSTPITHDIVLNAMWTCNGSNCNKGEDSTGVSDKDAPTCTLKVNKDGWATNKILTVNVNLGKNALAENYIEISRDNKKQTGWNADPFYNITENGVYTVKIRDVKGLESTCELEETRIDRTKPTVDGNWVQGETMQIALTGIDSQSKVVKYYLSQDPKDAPHQESSKWVTTSTFTVQEFGGYYAWVMDAAGNISNRIYIDDTKDVTLAPDAVLSGLSAQAEGGVVEESLDRAEAASFGLQKNYHVKQLASVNDLIAFSFSPNKVKYELTVRSNKISLYATLPKGSSFVEGYEPKENQLLEYGLNTILIKVKDSKGNIRNYTVLVNRKEDRSGVNLLSSLTVSGASFTFSPYQTEYTVKVPKGTTSVDINGSLSDPTASYVEGFEPREITLDGDTTDAIIKVRSASGSIRPYTIHIVKDGTSTPVPSSNTKGSNYLSSLTIVGANLSFDKNVLDYNVSVTNEIESVQIYAFAEDKAAKVSINGGGTLRVGENTVTVTVTSTAGRSRTYTIKIIRKEDALGISNNTELSSLSIGGYDIKFKPDKLDYELKVDKEKTLVIMATPKSDRSNVYIVGNEDLSTFSTLKISVVAEDGSTSVYSIDISKDAWNTRIEIIIAAIGLTIAVGATVVIQARRKQKRKALNQD